MVERVLPRSGGTADRPDGVALNGGLSALRGRVAGSVGQKSVWVAPTVGPSGSAVSWICQLTGGVEFVSEFGSRLSAGFSATGFEAGSVSPSFGARSGEHVYSRSAGQERRGGWSQGPAVQPRLLHSRQ